MKSKEERKALDKLEKELRENGIWGKMKAIYPMVGGGYPNKKIFNLKDIPRFRRKKKIRNIFKENL
jgi:hypothetical protein